MDKNRNPLLDLPNFTKYLRDRLGDSYLPGCFSSDRSGTLRTDFYRVVLNLENNPIVASVEVTSSRIKARIDLAVLNAETFNDITYRRKEQQPTSLEYDLVQNKRLDSHLEIPFP